MTDRIQQRPVDNDELISVLSSISVVAMRLAKKLRRLQRKQTTGAEGNCMSARSGRKG